MAEDEQMIIKNLARALLFFFFWTAIREQRHVNNNYTGRRKSKGGHLTNPNNGETWTITDSSKYQKVGCQDNRTNKVLANNIKYNKNDKKDTIFLSKNLGKFGLLYSFKTALHFFITKDLHQRKLLSLPC